MYHTCCTVGISYVYRVLKYKYVFFFNLHFPPSIGGGPNLTFDFNILL